jgi:hypothetical protein
VFRGPYFHISLEVGEVLVPGEVGFSQEGKRVVYPCQLRGVVNLSLIGLLSLVDDDLPDILGKGLVGVCGRG